MDNDCALDNKIHPEVVTKLKQFIKNKKIPNIILHGSNGCGKNTILSNFIREVYGNAKPVIKTHVMTVNCAYGRGIRFIREDLKYFAKTNLDTMNGEMFKSIVLLNADKLTIDAQSALRRCIELFCHSTRFFIVVEDKNKLLKPILSRFCEIYVPDHISTQGRRRGPTLHVNLHKVAIERVLGFKKHHDARILALKRLLGKHVIFPIKKTTDHQAGGDGDGDVDVVPTCIELMQLSETVAERGYSALDLIHILEEDTAACEDEDARFTKYELLMAFNGVKREFRNEKLLILFILYFIVFRSEIDLKNITFI
jgi:hypothetical protein